MSMVTAKDLKHPEWDNLCVPKAVLVEMLNDTSTYKFVANIALPTVVKVLNANTELEQTA